MRAKVMPWVRLGPTIVSKIGFRVITTKMFKMPNGAIKHYQIIGSEGEACACVIALTPNRKVIVTEEYRPGPDKVMSELPGGFVDENETPEVAVRRELLEETGYEAGRMVYTGIAYYDAYTCIKRHCFIAYDCCRIQAPKLETDEFLEVQEITIEKLLENALKGNMTDPAAVLFAYDTLTNLRG